MKHAPLILTMLSLLPIAAHSAVPKPEPVPGREAEKTFTPSGAHVGAYYVPSAENDDGGSSTDGNGFGASGYFPFAVSGYPLFAVGEYQTVDYDASDLKQLRLGVGYQVSSMLAIHVEHIGLDFSAGSADGWGFQGLIQTNTNGTLNAYGGLGYVTLKGDGDESANGLQFSIGATYLLNPQFTAFADYRSNNLAPDAGSDTTLTDFRLGIRLNLAK